MKSKLGGPIWLGGKSGQPGSKGTGKWVASQIPYAYYYLEPFAGMLGVLLQRQPSKKEIINDLDNTVVNFWQVIRDQPTSLRNMMEATPVWSRQLYYEATSLQNDPQADPVKRAWALVVSTKWGVKKEGTQPRHGWVPNWHPSIWTLQVEALAQRLKYVYIEQKPAEDLVAFGADLGNAVWYLDPPYAGADPACYKFGQPLNLDLWVPMLQSVKGKVAISGYGTEWDALGWQKQTFTTTGTVGHHTTSRDTTRTEVLWTNYSAGSGTLF